VMAIDYEVHTCLVSYNIVLALSFEQRSPQLCYLRNAASADGYPFTGFGRRGAPTWIPEPEKHDPGAFCQILFEDCLASVRDGVSVTLDGAFKRIAFDRSSQCGDCSEFVFGNSAAG
jgi:hypothetical protein